MKGESGLPPLDETLVAGHWRVLTSAALLGVATVVVKLAALAKDWQVAKLFGAGDDLDAFLIAFMIPSYGVAVLGHSFAAAFVPAYLQVHDRQSPAAARPHNRRRSAPLPETTVHPSWRWQARPSRARPEVWWPSTSLPSPAPRAEGRR